jgi:hypothetical protein
VRDFWRNALVPAALSTNPSSTMMFKFPNRRAISGACSRAASSCASAPSSPASALATWSFSSAINSRRVSGASYLHRDVDPRHDLPVDSQLFAKEDDA